MIAVAALWILMILSVFSIAIGTEVRSELAANRHHLEKLKSYHLAQAGIVLATQVIDRDTSLAIDHPLESWAEDEELFQKVRFGGGWVNVSYLPPRGSDERVAERY